MLPLLPRTVYHNVENDQTDHKGNTCTDKTNRSSRHQRGSKCILKDHVPYLRIAGANAGEGTAGKYNNARNETSWNICLPVNFKSDREYGKAYNKTCNTAIGQNTDCNGNRDHGRLFPKQSEAQPCDRLRAVGFLIHLPHQGTGYKDEEVSAKESGKAAHVISLERIECRDLTGQGDYHGAHNCSHIYIDALHNHVRQQTQCGDHANNTYYFHIRAFFPFIYLP